MAQENTQTQIGQVVEGPGKYQLERAIMDGQNVEFTIVEEGSSEDKKRLVVRVDTLQAENGSRDNWNILGQGGDSMAMRGFRIPGTKPITWDVKICYRSGKRSGQSKGDYELIRTY